MSRWISGFIFVSWMVVTASIGASTALAQDATPGATAQPVASAQEPQSSGESVLKASADWIQNKFGGSGQAKDGFYPEFNGLPAGSGIVAGPGFRQRFFEGRALVSASGAYSVSRGKFGQATFELPRLADDHLSVGAQVKRQDFTRVSFFGIGPASAEGDRTTYGLKNTDYTGFATLKPKGQLTVGGHFGFSQHVDIVPPRSATYPSTQDLFNDSTAPGLTGTPAFLHGDAYVDVDTRDHHSYPTSGGDYRVTFLNYNDRDFGLYSFRRVEAEASQYVPLHKHSIIALRGRVAGSGTGSGEVVPYYLLPALGGSKSLRGYSDYRFMDRNLLLLSAEYRLTVFGALDGVLFYDTGKVAPRFGDLSLSNLRKSYGVGFRYHSDKTTFARLDIGRSQEGTRFLISVGEVFRPGHGSVSIPYVP